MTSHQVNGARPVGSATPPPTGRPGRRRRRWILLAVVALVTAGAVVAAAIGIGGPDGGAQPPTAAPATATVTRADLVDYVSLSGTLGYGADVDIDARGAGGTVTALPAVGSTIGRGQALFSVDNAPVVLFFGRLPLYRPLQAGVTGPDVREVEFNLTTLGFGGFTVDDVFTASTAAAVRRWQHHLGLTETGTVQPAQVTIAAGPVRVATHQVALGDPATGTVLTVTGTEKLITAQLPVDEAKLVKLHAAVTVTFAEGSGIAGRVASIGTVATVPSAGDQPGNPSDATVPLTVTLTDPASVAGFDGSPATIQLIADRRDHVLAVPVEALLALREGGFGVEVVEGGRSRIVAVQVGLFADGRVEITSGAVTEGMKVVVPG